MPIDDRKFTDEEVREILKRAVDKKPSRAVTRGEGLSLAELKTIGEEVGIDPARLEDAALLVAQEGAHAPNLFIGGPTVLHFERKVTAEFKPEETPEILALIRRTTGHQGRLEEVHGTLEWSAEGETGNRYITISSRGGATTITGTANLTAQAAAMFGPAGTVGILLTVLGTLRWIKSGSELMLIIAVAIVSVLYPVLRMLYAQNSAKESAKLQQTVEELARLAARSEEAPER